MNGFGFDLNERVALVTGAGSADGIGMAVARLLGQLGASVVITATTDRIESRAEELRGEGITAVATWGDLTDASVASATVDLAISEFGRLDVLVNNAGMTATSDPQTPSSVADMTDAEWATTIDRNLTTSFNVSRAAVRQMLRQRFGRIVNVASTSGPVSAYPGDAAYHAAKAGMVGLTRAMAIETAAEGITVNAVAPGWITTSSSTEYELEMGRATPVGRSGEPDEVAAAVAGLAMPASGYTSGHLVVVDGANSVSEDRNV